MPLSKDLNVEKEIAEVLIKVKYVEATPTPDAAWRGTNACRGRLAGGCGRQGAQYRK
jgi:hypothetical protein